MLGNGTHAVLLGVWEELRQSIGAWLDVRQRPAGQQSAALQVTLLDRAFGQRETIKSHPASI